MLSYQNDPKVKQFYIKRILEHHKHDDLIKGQYWEKGKGCAIGCLMESESPHEQFAKEIGPEWLSRIADAIFEHLPNDKAKQWAIDFPQAIPVGVDLEPVKKQFLVFILEHSLESMNSTLNNFDHKENKQVVEVIANSEKAIKEVMRLLKLERISQEKLGAAAGAAEAAARAARAAARVARAAAGAARAAARAARVARAAAGAAWAAARAAWAAAEVAWAAARAAAGAAWAAAGVAWAAAGVAAEAAEAAYVTYADKLLELLKEVEGE